MTARISSFVAFLYAALRLAAINAAVLCLLFIPVELIFGNWIRPISVQDLKRFSIPVDVTLSLDVSALYEGGPRNPIVSSRDRWGLRGNYSSLGDVDVLTIGGSTTEQRYLDDEATWQSAAQRELVRLGYPLVFANAGVDGQSTIGHLFNFEYWLPLLPGLRPRAVLFYIGVNDVLGRADRPEFDRALDASSWRVRSASFGLLRTLLGNLRARRVGVVHGRMPALSLSDFTEVGLLHPSEQRALAEEVSVNFRARVAALRQRASALGSAPIFITQPAFAWRTSRGVSRGVRRTGRFWGRTLNFADVSFLHQRINDTLLEYCELEALVCFDLANEVEFDAGDFYDFLHNTPKGAQKIGAYLAGRLRVIALPRRAVAKGQRRNSKEFR